MCLLHARHCANSFVSILSLAFGQVFSDSLYQLDKTTSLYIVWRSSPLPVQFTSCHSYPVTHPTALSSTLIFQLSDTRTPFLYMNPSTHTHTFNLWVIFTDEIVWLFLSPNTRTPWRTVRYVFYYVLTYPGNRMLLSQILSTLCRLWTLKSNNLCQKECFRPTIPNPKSQLFVNGHSSGGANP